MGTVKQANFRIGTDSAEKFRSFCEEQGMNQAQGFDHLLSVLEMDRAKTILINRQTEITDFEMHIKAVMSSYLQSIELNEHAEARVREEFISQLNSRDQTILDYQNQLEAAKMEIVSLKAFESALVDLEAELGNLRHALSSKEEEIQAIQQQHSSQLGDKENIISMLEKNLLIAEKKAVEFDDLKREYDLLADELHASQEDLRAQKREFDLSIERAARESEKALDKAVSKVRGDSEEMIRSLREQLQTVQIDSERQLRKVEKESSLEIRKLESEKAELREKLAKYQ